MVSPWNTAPDLVYQEEIGRGSFAVVYKAYADKIFGKPTYAVKKISVDRFKVYYWSRFCDFENWMIKLSNEVKILKKLNNENVVKYYDCWFEGPEADTYNTVDPSQVQDEFEFTSCQAYENVNFLFIRLEFCNSDLRKWLKARNSPEERRIEEIHEIFKQILKGLKYINNERIIHRDLKPENIFIVEMEGSMVIKIGDFGIATLFDHVPDVYDGLGGTIYYRSPEIDNKDYPIDFTTDIFSTGLIFFECLEPSLNDPEKRHAVFSKIQYGNFKFPDRNETNFPSEMDLIKMMTKRDRTSRLGVKEALKYLKENVMCSRNILIGGSRNINEVVESFEGRDNSETLKPWNHAPGLVYQEEIGKGCFGTVYKAYRTLDPISYAVKKILVFPPIVDGKHNDMDVENWISRLRNKVEDLKKLNHDCVIKYYYDWFEGPLAEVYSSREIPTVSPADNLVSNASENFFFIGMLYCSSDMRKWLRARNSTQERNIQEIHEIFKQILNGLKYIHDQGIIHRDLKPENIMILEIDGSMQIQIGDFELDAVMRSINNNKSNAVDELRLDTLYYKSPEMNEGNYYHDFRTDVYTVGLVFLECIDPSLNAPKKRYSVLTIIQYGNYKFPEETEKNFPDELELIKMMTAKDIHNRPFAEKALEYLKLHLTKENQPSSSKIPSNGFSTLTNLGKLGEGGFGSVFKVRAEEEFNKPIYAVKKISVAATKLKRYETNTNIRGWIAPLRNEVEALKELSNDHVVQYIRCWFEGSEAKIYNTIGEVSEIISGFQKSYCSKHTEDNNFCIQMRFCKSDLRKWLKARNSLEERNTVTVHEIFRQTLKGLKYIHGKGIIHRDLNPRNILIDSDDTDESIKIKIGDFGLATVSKLAVKDTNGILLPNFVNERVGTELYMSPEMFYREKYDFKTDIYSTGLVFHECIDPSLNVFKNRSIVFEQILNANYKLPAGDETGFHNEMQLIKSMIDKDQRHRLSAQEAMEFLKTKVLKKRLIQ